MLKVYQLQNGGLRSSDVSADSEIPATSLWIDLLNPTLDERRSIDKFLNMELPTRADMEEIEISSRLYQEDDGVFMTALILSNSESDTPKADVVTFVLAHESW